MRLCRGGVGVLLPAVRAVHKPYPWMPLAGRIKAALKNLNDDCPRPVLSSCTAAEVYQRERIELRDRAQSKKEVEQKGGGADQPSSGSSGRLA